SHGRSRAGWIGDGNSGSRRLWFAGIKIADPLRIEPQDRGGNLGLKGSLIDRIRPVLLLHDGMRMWCFQTWAPLDIDRPGRQNVVSLVCKVPQCADKNRERCAEGQ